MGPKVNKAVSVHFRTQSVQSWTTLLNVGFRTRLQIRDHDFQIHVASCVDE